MRLSAAKGRLDRSLNTAEQELQEAQQQILMLQVRIDHKSKLEHLLRTHCGLPKPQRLQEPECGGTTGLGVCFDSCFAPLSGIRRSSCKSQSFNSSFTPYILQTFVFIPFLFLRNSPAPKACRQISRSTW